MASIIDWYGENASIPKSDITLFALPGVGDVGKKPFNKSEKEWIANPSQES